MTARRSSSRPRTRRDASGERDGCAYYEQSKLDVRVKRITVLEQAKYAALAAQVDAAVAAEKPVAEPVEDIKG